ncbi:MAG: hypothetical protein JW924_11865 [Fusobacteriaceae bacterium]|nr:hypothetical protein [Fusobacteriaceae bacterium]
MSVNLKLLYYYDEDDFESICKELGKECIYRISDKLLAVKYKKSPSYRDIMQYISKSYVDLYIVYFEDYLKILNSDLMKKIEDIDVEFIKQDDYMEEILEEYFEKIIKLKGVDLKEYFEFKEIVNHFSASIDIKNMEFELNESGLLNKITVYNNGIINFETFSEDILRKLGEIL